MTRRRAVVATVVGSALCTFLAACDDPEELYDIEYDDGFAVGYNTACEISSTLIEGDFSNEDYTRGYADGEADGIRQCHTDTARD